MRAKAMDIAAASADHAPAGIEREDIVEAGAFLCWLEDHNFTFLGYRDYDIVQEDGEVRLTARARYRPGHPAPVGGAQDLLVAGLRPPSARRAGQGAGALPPQPDEGQLARHRPPPRLPGLRRRQALRRRRERDRRAALPRPLHPHRLPRQPARHPDPAPQGRRGARARRAAARQPQREGADPDPRDPPARRADPGFGGRAVRHRDGHPAPGRAPARAAVRAPRRLRALPLLPGLRPARPLQHGQPAAHRAHPARGLRRAEHRLHHARLGVGARPPALHGLRRARQMRRARHRRGRAPDPRGHALVGRRPGAGAGRGARRGARQRAVPALGRRLPDGLPRRLGGALGGDRHHPHREPGRGRHRRSSSTARSRRRQAPCGPS